MRARCVEDTLDADLELVRGGDGGRAHGAPFVRSTTCAKRSSRCSHVLMPSKAYGPSMHRRTRPTFSVVDELRLLEQPDVLLHPGQRHAEGLGELADRRAAGAEPFEHGAPGRVGEGRERAVDVV